MNREQKERFWKDFTIITQEEDPDVYFANPSDVSRSLVKARNWAGTLVQNLMDLNERMKNIGVLVNKRTREISNLEKTLFARQAKIPTWATKNKDTQRMFAYSLASPEEQKQLEDSYKHLAEDEQAMTELQVEKESIEMMRKVLEKSTDWLIQYLNWFKFDARDLS